MPPPLRGAAVLYGRLARRLRGGGPPGRNRSRIGGRPCPRLARYRRFPCPACGRRRGPDAAAARAPRPPSRRLAGERIAGRRFRRGRGSAPLPLYPARDGSGRYYLEARAGGALRGPHREPLPPSASASSWPSTASTRSAASASPVPRHPARPGPHVRGRSLGRGAGARLAHVAAGRPPVHVRRRARLLRLADRPRERQDGLDPGLGLPRAIRCATSRRRASNRGTADPTRRRQPEELGRRDGGTAARRGSHRGRGGATRGAAPRRQGGRGRARRTARCAAGRLETARSAYPGTGWGSPASDPATVVTLRCREPRPADTVTLRYEYAPALRALGILPAGGGPRPAARARPRRRLRASSRLVSRGRA